MPPPLLAITIFIAVFAIATLRNVHLGILMFPAACAVGIVLAGIQFSPYTLLGVAVAANFVLLVAAVLMFGRAGRGQMTTERDAIAPALARGFAPHHVVTLVCMMCLVASVVACAVRGIEPDIGVFAFAFGAVLTLVYPSFGTPAFARIDWSTVFAVGGIVTFVGVLQKLGAVDLLAHAAMNVGTPLLTAVVICMTATLVASAPEGERPRVRTLTMRWGMSMVVVGPVAFAVLLLALRGT